MWVIANIADVSKRYAPDVYKTDGSSCEELGRSQMWARAATPDVRMRLRETIPDMCTSKDDRRYEMPTPDVSKWNGIQKWVTVKMPNVANSYALWFEQNGQFQIRRYQLWAWVTTPDVSNRLDTSHVGQQRKRASGRKPVVRDDSRCD